MIIQVWEKIDTNDERCTCHFFYPLFCVEAVYWLWGGDHYNSYIAQTSILFNDYMSSKDLRDENWTPQS